MGNSRVSLVNSLRTNSRVDPAARATPAIFHKGSGDMLPTLTASTARVSSSNCANGSLPAPALASCARAGNTSQTSATYTSVIGTSEPNAARQAFICANTPPTAGPSNVATPHMPEISAIAMGHKRSSNTE